MAPKTNWLEKLQKHDRAIVGDYNPFAHTLMSPSPSFNMMFGKTWGLPRGFTMALYGPPKAGKTIISNAMIGQLHRDDPEAFALKFDTELRERGQMSPENAAMWGIDKSRYQAYGTNIPSEIFDYLENDVRAMCQSGLNVGLVIIDSITGVRGRRDLNADTIDTQQRGDHALTVQTGLQRLLTVQRECNFALILTTHVRAEQDEHEIRRGNTKRMAGSFAFQHHAEYFAYIERLKIKDSNKDLSGNAFENTANKDIAGNAEVTGHKIRATMKDSSFGCEGRQSIFTFDHRRGIINVEDEIFGMATGRGVIETTGAWYAFGDKKWNGKAAVVQAMKDEPALAKAMVAKVRELDLAGAFEAQDAVAREAVLAEVPEAPKAEGKRSRAARD